MSSNSMNTPFLEVRSFDFNQESFETELTAFSSPSHAFLSKYTREDSDELYDANAEAYLTFLNELYDEEFNEALYELADEASSLYQGRMQSDFNPEQMLERHFAPIVREAEMMFEALAQSLEQRGMIRLTDREIEAAVDQYRPENHLSPAFENLFGGLKNLAKKALKGAVSLGLGPVLGKLKALIKPLLERVIKHAIGKLPPNLQPIAQKLAEKLPFLREFENADATLGESSAMMDVSAIQHEFNYQVANVLFAPGDVELEMELARVRSEARQSNSSMPAELDEARERFINELGRLRDGEDPAPLVENFLPAILPVLKLGLRLAGRPRVIKFLAAQLGKLIQRFVGPQYTAPLSQAIVAAGLGLLGLETREDETRAAHTAVASTIEETVRRVADLPEAVLSNPELFEAYALEAFEQAAAANLPPVLSESVYQQRPDLREAKTKGLWMLKRIPGKSGFKHYSRKFKKRISPYEAMAVQTFGGDTISEHLQEQMDLPAGAEVEVELQLYECLPGTTIRDIIRMETGGSGMGGVDSQAMAQFHPLTLEAAATLLAEPGLGKQVSNKGMADPINLASGDRVYQMKVAGKRPLMTMEPNGKSRMRRRSRINLKLDFPKNQLCMCLYLSEVSAQKIAAKLRSKAHIGMAVNQFQTFMSRKLPTILAGRNPGRIRIIHEMMTPDQAMGGALAMLPPMVKEKIMMKIQEWTLKPLTEFLKENSAQFIAATEDSKDGISLCFTLSNPPDFPMLRQLFKGKMSAPSSLNFGGEEPLVKINVAAGYHYHHG